MSLSASCAVSCHIGMKCLISQKIIKIIKSIHSAPSLTRNLQVIAELIYEIKQQQKLKRRSVAEFSFARIEWLDAELAKLLPDAEIGCRAIRTCLTPSSCSWWGRTEASPSSSSSIKPNTVIFRPYALFSFALVTIT